MFVDETEEDDDLYEALEVSTTAPAARGNDLLDALGEEEEEEIAEEDEGVVIATLDMGETMGGEPEQETFFPQEEISEEEEDVDPFEELGASRPISSNNEESAVVSDALAAFMDDEDEDGESGELQEVSLFEETEEDDVDEEEEAKAEEKPKADPKELYRFLLEGVWVDDVLDPAEVALMSRKRRELNISFETHLEILKEILHE
jgi:hypothetical protein